MQIPVKRNLFQTYPYPHDRNSFSHRKAWFLAYRRGLKCADVRSREMFDLKEEHSLRVAMEIEALATLDTYLAQRLQPLRSGDI